MFVCVREMFMYILLCMCGWKTEIGLSISFHFSISLLNSSWPSNSKDGPDIITLNQFLKYRQMPSIWLLLQLLRIQICKQSLYLLTHFPSPSHSFHSNTKESGDISISFSENFFMSRKRNSEKHRDSEQV